MPQASVTPHAVAASKDPLSTRSTTDFGLAAQMPTIDRAALLQDARPGTVPEATATRAALNLQNDVATVRSGAMSYVAKELQNPANLPWHESLGQAFASLVRSAVQARPTTDPNGATNSYHYQNNTTGLERAGYIQSLFAIA